MKKQFTKRYLVSIDTVPLPEKEDDRIELIVNGINPTPEKT